MDDRYLPPLAPVDDVSTDPAASLSRPGLVRLYHRLVLASVVLGLLLAFLPWSRLPLSYELQQAVQAAGLGAIVPLEAMHLLWWIQQPLWVAAGIGLYFFRSWARWLFTVLYGVSILSSLVGGAIVHLPWEAAMVTAVTLVDGALLALVFLPPLNAAFGEHAARGKTP